jgi:hypothetical protein
MLCHRFNKWRPHANEKDKAIQCSKIRGVMHKNSRRKELGTTHG